MNLFSLISLIVSISCGLLAVFTFSQARNRVHYIWAIFNLIVASWALGAFWAGISDNSQSALLMWRFAYIFATFISIVFYHLIIEFCGIKRPGMFSFVYIQGFLFVLLIAFSDYVVGSTFYIFNSIHYHKATLLFAVFLGIWFFITGSAFVELYGFTKRSQGIQKIQSLFLFWGMLFGHTGGVMSVIPAFNISLYPAWHFSICIYTIIVTFAILRYNFLDIRVALARLLVPVSIFAAISFIFSFVYFEMNLFTAASLVLAILCTLLAYMIFAYARQKMHYMWALFNVAVAVWGYAAFLIGRCIDSQLAVIFWRIAFIGVLFISIFFYHVITLFCQIKRPRTIFFAYAQGCFFLLLNATDLYISEVFFLRESFYYLQAKGIFFSISFAIWLILVVAALTELIIHYRKFESHLQKTQALYLFVGFGVGFLGGTTNFFPMFGIDIYPFGNLTIPLYCIIATYAILRYQLMDIRIAVTRVGIFVLVYSIILGIPFGLTFWGKEDLLNIFGQLWYWAPIILSTIFATAGPFVFLYFQRKAENALLQEEKRTQDLLNSASKGMRTVRSLPKLSELIVDVLVKNLRLDNAAIYLHEPMNNHYLLKVSQREHSVNVNIAKNEPLIRRLEETQYPVVYEEVKLLSDSEQNGNKVLREIAGQMAGLQASVVVPAMSDNFLLGFIVLGERKDKRLYSADLINVLSVLGNQAALAIENCHYIQRMQAEGLAERMISLDHMASSMAHEIDNPMHIIRTSLSFVKSALLRDPRVAMPEEIKQDFDESLARSLNASERVSSMIKAILDYSRMGTGKLESIRVSDALEGFLQLIQPQIREERVQFAKEIENDLPPVLGDRVQMEEIFMNFVRNSLHAVRRNEEKKISLKIFRKNETIIRIECSDNGYGIPGEIINDIFLSSMTTKGSTEGTGLGLFRVRKIVDIFRGKVWAESEGKGKGATFIVELPVYGGHKSNTNGD